MAATTEGYREMLLRSERADQTDVLRGETARHPLTDTEIERMVERYAEKRYRRLAKASPSPIDPRRSDEERYERELRRIVLSPLFRNLRSGLSRAVAAGMAFETLRGLVWNASMERLVEEEVAAQAARLDGYHRDRLIRTFRSALGVDIRPVLNDDAIRPLMDAWRRENVSLIRTIPTRLHDGLYQRMSETFAQRPFDQQALRNMLNREFNIAGSNLRRITRDQTSKAIGQLTQARHRQIGITEYIWRTAQDERVRDTHAALDGTRQGYDSPPSVGNPGDDILCRCVAIPYIPEAETGERPARGRRKGSPHYTRRGKPAARRPAEYTVERHRRDGEFRSADTLSEGTNAYYFVAGGKQMQGVDYGVVNQLLRERKPLDAAHQRMLLQVMGDMRPLRSERIVYRGINDAIDVPVGKVIEFPAFTSTSMNYGSAFRGRTIYQIRVPQGTQAIVGNTREREVLLPIGTKFKVVARTTNGRGRIVLIGDLQ